MFRPVQPRRALSLVEVVIASGLALVLFSLAYNLLLASHREQAGSRYRLIASNLARQTMEKVRALPCSRLPEAVAGRRWVDPIEPPDHLFNTTLGGLRMVEILPWSLHGTTGKRVIVTVAWDARDLGEDVRSEERLVLLRSCAPPAEAIP